VSLLRILGASPIFMGSCSITECVGRIKRDVRCVVRSDPAVRVGLCQDPARIPFLPFVRLFVGECDGYCPHSELRPVSLSRSESHPLFLTLMGFSRRKCPCQASHMVIFVGISPSPYDDGDVHSTLPCFDRIQVHSSEKGLSVELFEATVR
jgi:hypothetical protein